MYCRSRRCPEHLTVVLQCTFKRTLQLGWGKLPPGVSQVLCHLEIKSQRLYVLEGKLFNNLHASLHW